MTQEINRRVVCAAIRANDGSLILGVRHYSPDMYQQILQREDREKFAHRNGVDQGFVDQYGVYMTRAEAYQVAVQSNQIIREDACVNQELYSEALY